MNKLEPEYKSSALDSAEHDLYDPRKKMEDMTPHHMRDRKSQELPTSWGDNTPIIIQAEQEKGFSFGARLLILSIFILIATLGFTAWKVMSLRNVVSPANIDMTADITPYVEGGESVPITLALSNKNASPLQNAVVTLIYEQGTGSQDEQAKVHEKRDIGEINPGEYKRQDFRIVLYGSEAESRTLTFKLEYKVSGSNAVFSKVINTVTTLKTPPISVKIDGPKTLSIGQSGTFSITVKNNSATTSLPSVLQLTLPNTFTLSASSPKTISTNSSWSVPALQSGESTTYSVTGSLSGTDGETVTIKGIVGFRGETENSVGIIYSSQVVDIKLRASPLAIGMELDTESGSVDKLRYGDRANINITYSNVGKIPLQDVTLKLALTGEAALYKQIDPLEGHYDSVSQTITWDKTNFAPLATIPPGVNGAFRIFVPIVSKGTNSPALKIIFTGSASTAGSNDVIATISKNWFVQGSAIINAETHFKSSPFANSGPIPPVANKETTYTLHLAVSAQNALINTKASFILPAYVTWRGVTSDDAAISYDTKTRTVTWTIGRMDAGKKVTADIGVSVKPSQSHVGKMPSITSGIVLDADEEVSQSHLRSTISPLTTYIAGEVWGDVRPSVVIGE